jgi:hypothetical protein
MSRKYTLVALAGLTAYSAGAQAFDLDPSIFSFNGFGTLGAVHSSEDQADYSVGFKPNGAGFTHNWSFDVDSLLALQMTAKLSDKLTGVVQVVAVQQSDNRYGPVVEWANLKYAFTPNVAVRVGRIAMATYLASDVRNVHYAMTPVRPSTEIYSLLPISNSDGVDATYRMQLGKISNTVQVLYGENTVDVNTAVTVKAKGVWGIVDTIEYGSLLLHFAYQGQQIFPEAVFIPPGGQPLKIIEAGVSYDPGTWYASAEWARIFAGYGDSKAINLNAGYRLNKLTPYLGYGKLTPLGLSTMGVAAEQMTLTAGLRWDFMRNFDLKGQFDRVKADNGSFGQLKNVQPGLQPDGSTNLFTLAVDFIF